MSTLEVYTKAFTETFGVSEQEAQSLKYQDIKASSYYWIERTPQSTVDETLEKVDRHFGLK